MARPPIAKSCDNVAHANMPDYARAISDFSWDKARAMLDGLPGGGLNIAHEAVDRHVAHGRGAKCALRWLPAKGDAVELSYQDLHRQTNKFANVLKGLEVAPGERVYALLGRTPELHIAALGALKTGAIFCPLFSAFGPEPTRARMEIGEANVLITTAAHYRKKVAPWRAALASLRHVIIIDQAPAEGVLGYHALMDAAAERLAVVATRPDDPALLHFTSGTTGKPKGVVHVHEAVIAHHMTGFYALDLHPDDIFWCTADPGWVTGMSYGVIAPLTLGVTSIVDEGEFDALRWRRILREERVNVWYTAPTAIRMLMKADAQAPQAEHFPALRFLASVGEPLNPEAVEWSVHAFGRPFHDNWWQTETGGIMIANYASMDVRPGSMGKPLPGIEAAIVERAGDGVRVTDTPDTPGELALKPGWPSMMRAYLHQDERYKKCFVGGWYLTGDLAMRDAEGYYWFVGRADDLIKSAGHLIGPFEVESALMEHPAIAEAAVIGLPDPVAGEVVKAFVVAKPGHVANEALRRDILGHARKRLGPAIAPKIIAFIDDLPKTRSGKIMRRLLKARELGLPEGDLSTLEGGAQ
ncbi:MAG: acetate--CoA ligase [Hyphomonadaceae bacterium]|nr:acetate--CoA ligase [Hyphomonadaceae bacterium]